MKSTTFSRSVAGSALGLLLTAGVATAGLADAAPGPEPRADKHVGKAAFPDARNDVKPNRLDIRKVTVTNTADELRVRVAFPGRPKTYDFPLGAISVFLDTDAKRKGPEYGHFMDFWSDYRFAPTTKTWREKRVRAWMHSPDGRCVETAGLTSDPGSKLRWFEYVVKKTDGCFDAGAVRVAVSTITTGTKTPVHFYKKPRFDHLGAEHRWTPWVAEAK